MTGTTRAARCPTSVCHPTSPRSANACREFLAVELAPELTHGHLDRTDLTGWDEQFERNVLRHAGEAGILGVSLPTEFGGGGHPPSWHAMVAFEAAYHDAPLIDTAAALVAPTVLAFGSDAQRSAFLPAAIRGTITACIAYTEAGAGSDLSNITTIARAVGDGFLLSGEKVLVTGAHKADWCCTIARTDHASGGRHGLSMFLLDMRTPGIECVRHPTANRWTLSTVRFDGATVSRGRAPRRAGSRVAPAHRRVARRTIGHRVAGVGDADPRSAAHALHGDARPATARRPRRPRGPAVRGPTARGARPRAAGPRARRRWSRAR